MATECISTISLNPRSTSFFFFFFFQYSAWPSLKHFDIPGQNLDRPVELQAAQNADAIRSIFHFLI